MSMGVQARQVEDMTREDRIEAWGRGPWLDESDRVEFEAHGFPCLILRNRLGILCGYVAMPAEHPWYVDADSNDIPAYGGVTYSSKCHGKICHVPKPGASDDVMWLGFDCAHTGDLVPSFKMTMPGDTYKDIAFVRAECETLA